ncbi:uncharacterized protein LOC105428308 [Pogonomyrmex barbatus]|uniref:Uncharacterized protein LOC105428308 n=1 Tax=Pogonomyrmex barbatus TaxID=144034 RepID=A0A6I9WHR4_9HYME|nr:uncharacterized protein LOC105428308 [Pogonomyrmex barbatus]
MVDEHAQAISVANRYFVLVDGMISGFKDHLAEDVVLKWFGQTISGKENVAVFLLSNKMKSFHTFSNIIPISGPITYEEKWPNWKIKRPLDQNANSETYTNNYFREALACTSHVTEKSTTHENLIDCNKKGDANDTTFVHDEKACNKYEFDVEKYIDKLKIVNNNNANPNEFNADANAEIDKYQSNDLHGNDLYNLFEPEITSQSIVKKIHNINRIKLKEEMAPTIRAINRECGQGDEPVATEANATKYLEASGEIKFVRLGTQSDSPFLYHWSKLWRKKIWKRECKLQIAYSLLTDKDSPKIIKKDYAQENINSISNLSVCHDKVQKSKLPSLEEAIQVSNTLIRDVNYFGGYLQPLNFFEDRKNFLKSFETEMMKKNSSVHTCAHYVDNKLIFDFSNKKPLNVTYLIHKIVYTKVSRENGFNNMKQQI